MTRMRGVHRHIVVCINGPSLRNEDDLDARTFKRKARKNAGGMEVWWHGRWDTHGHARWHIGKRWSQLELRARDILGKAKGIEQMSEDRNSKQGVLHGAKNSTMAE